MTRPKLRTTQPNLLFPYHHLNAKCFEVDSNPTTMVLESFNEKDYHAMQCALRNEPNSIPYGYSESIYRVGAPNLWLHNKNTAFLDLKQTYLKRGEIEQKSCTDDHDVLHNSNFLFFHFFRIFPCGPFIPAVHLLGSHFLRLFSSKLLTYPEIFNVF